MKKILIASILVCTFLNSSNNSIAQSIALSDEPVQIHPARTDVATPMSEPTAQKTKTAPSAKSKTISTKIEYTKYRRHKIKKAPPKKIVNYDEIDKLIENCYFDQADRLITSAINDNSKDIKANALWVVSLAKQYKLDPAQKELNSLLKAYPNNADLHYAQGIVYYKRTTSSNMAYINQTQSLLEDSLREFNKAISLDKTDARYYNAAGVASINLGKCDDAKKLFSKAFELNKKYSTAIDNLGTIDYSEGKFNDAEKKFKQALLYNTQNTTAMYHLAQVETQKENYSNALTYLNNALAINPNSYTTYNLMGEVYEKQGNEAAAINAYKKSVAIKPEFALPYLNLAGIYEKRGDSEFALEQLKTTLSVSAAPSSDYYDAKLKIADISLASGKYNQAIENYSTLVGIKDYNDNALKGLANAYFEQAQASATKAILGSNGDLFKAIDSINKAIKANGEDLELHLAKLKLAKITDQPALSEKILDEITKSTDGGLVNTVVKGEAYLTLNNYPEAKKEFDLATNSTKTVQEDLYLAEIFVYHKQYENAKIVLQKVLAKEPQNQQALCNLEYIKKNEKYADDYLKAAEYYLKSKNSIVATGYLSSSIALNPNSAKAHLLLAQLLEKKKDYQGAVLNYKAYLGLESNPSDKKAIENKIKRLDKRL